LQCPKCNRKYEREFFCPDCRYAIDKIEKAHTFFDSLAFTDEKVRVLVTGLMILDFETNASDQGGDGHIMSFPWIELRFPSDSKKMDRLCRVLEFYNKADNLNWIVEEQLGGCHWLVPENKELPIAKLHEAIEDLGWFLYKIR